MSVISKEPIKVKELIKYLSQFDGEMIVQVESTWGEYAPDEINQIKESEDKIILSSAQWD